MGNLASKSDEDPDPTMIKRHDQEESQPQSVGSLSGNQRIMSDQVPMAAVIENREESQPQSIEASSENDLLIQENETKPQSAEEPSSDSDSIVDEPSSDNDPIEEDPNEEEPITDEEKEGIKKWVNDSKAIRIMAYGATGTGKSSLLNAIIGENIFQESGYDEFDPETKKVEEKHCTKAGVDIFAYDTPGLQDYSGNAEQYLAEINNNCSDIDLFLFCLKLITNRSDPELTPPDAAIRKITECLGKKVWKHSVIALTFANIQEESLRDIDPSDVSTRFKKLIADWEDAVKEELEKLEVDKKIIKNLKFVPVGYIDPHLECQRYWLTNFWTKSLESMKKRAQAAMVKIAVSRFSDESDVKPEDFDQDLASQPLVYKKNAIAGGTVAGVATGVACAATGALIGGLLIGIPSFGIFAGLGMALGLGVGAAVGAHAGAAAGILVSLYRKNKKMKKVRLDSITKLTAELGGKEH